jgi:hypothetical protein
MLMVVNLNPSLEAQENLNPGLEAQENQGVEKIEIEEVNPSLETRIKKNKKEQKNNKMKNNKGTQGTAFRLHKSFYYYYFNISIISLKQ